MKVELTELEWGIDTSPTELPKKLSQQVNPIRVIHR